MQNQFDSANYPTSEPGELVAGSLWAWTRPDITEAYPTASYTLKYKLSLQVSPFAVITLTAAKTGAKHTIEASSTGAHVAGEYSLQAIVVRDSDSVELVVDSGRLTVVASDTVSQTYTTLVAIQAAILGAASQDQLVREIAGRRLESRSYGELLQLEKEYLNRWANEKAAVERKRGRLGPRVLVGMSA